MGRTFRNGVYSVTVNDDRSIRVRPGDWISKYSAAIYGDPKVNWKRFKRKDSKGRFIDLIDPNKIDAGELLWHPDPLPDERLADGPAARSVSTSRTSRPGRGTRPGPRARVLRAPQAMAQPGQ